MSTELAPSPSTDQPLLVHIGGPDDPWLLEGRGVFPSTTSAAAERHYAEQGVAMPLLTMGHHVIEFIEDNLVLGSGSWSGKPFTLLDWQKRMLLEMYEVKHHEISDSYRRTKRWAYVQVPKKNGKTEMIAALGLYHLVAEPDVNSPNIVCAAASEDQADLVFGAAARMADWSSVSSSVTQMRRLLKAPSTMGEFHRLAAVGGSNDGKNISTTLIDELHEWTAPKSRAIFDVITQGGGARPEYYNIMITTPGHDMGSICFEFYEHSKNVIDGSAPDPTLYSCIFEAPEDSDYTDPHTWWLANPSYGMIQQEDFYQDMLTKKSEAVYRRYFCGQWTDAEEVWEAAGLWDDLEGSPVLYDDRKTYVGIDIGRRHDSTAIVIAQYDYDKKKVQYVSKLWTNPYRRGSSGYSSWTMDVAEVEDYLRDLYNAFPEATALHEDEEDYRVPGPAFLYDPHFFSRSSETLAADGLNMLEVPQSATRMVPASQRLFEVIKTGELEHDGHPTMRKHIRSVVPKMSERGWRIAKQDSTKAIDGAIAGAMAVYFATEGLDDGSEEAPNVW